MDDDKSDFELRRFSQGSFAMNWREITAEELAAWRAKELGSLENLGDVDHGVEVLPDTLFTVEDGVLRRKKIKPCE